MKTKTKLTYFANIENVTEGDLFRTSHYYEEGAETVLLLETIADNKYIFRVISRPENLPSRYGFFIFEMITLSRDRFQYALAYDLYQKIE